MDDHILTIQKVSIDQYSEIKISYLKRGEGSWDQSQYFLRGLPSLESALSTPSESLCAHKFEYGFICLAVNVHIWSLITTVKDIVELCKFFVSVRKFEHLTRFYVFTKHGLD